MKTLYQMCNKLHQIRLYPTFKEWKPISEDCYFYATKSVYILPLRNENQQNN